MKPIDLIVSTVKAVTVVNIFLCAYKLWILSQIGVEMTEQTELQESKKYNLLQRKVGKALSTFEEANKRRAQHYPDLGLPKSTSTKFQQICKHCKQMVEKIGPHESSIKIPDICLAIYAKLFVPTDFWVDEFFTKDGKIKADPFRDQSDIVVSDSNMQLNKLRQDLKSLRCQPDPSTERIIHTKLVFF